MESASYASGRLAHVALRLALSAALMPPLPS